MVQPGGSRSLGDAQELTAPDGNAEPELLCPRSVLVLRDGAGFTAELPGAAMPRPLALRRRVSCRGEARGLGRFREIRIMRDGDL